jgi:putative membrane protein
MMWGNGTGWGMGWAWLFLVLLLVGVGVLIAVLVLALNRGRIDEGGRNAPLATPGGPVPRRAREILEERFARGEIDAEEFRERMGVLEQHDP